MEVVAADLQAINDVVQLLAESSDSLTTEQAIELIEAARKAQQSLKAAIEMLEAQAISTIERPLLMGNVVWTKVPSVKKRPVPNIIDKAVLTFSAHPDGDGVMPTAYEAAQTAINMMKGLYVSPSTVPKVGGVKALGLDMGDVCTEEHTGYELKRTELE